MLQRKKKQAKRVRLIYTYIKEIYTVIKRLLGRLPRGFCGCWSDIYIYTLYRLDYKMTALYKHNPFPEPRLWRVLVQRSVLSLWVPVLCPCYFSVILRWPHSPPGARYTPTVAPGHHCFPRLQALCDWSRLRGQPWSAPAGSDHSGAVTNMFPPNNVETLGFITNICKHR